MELADYILKHYEPYRKWDRNIFNGWLGWHCHNGFTIRAVNDDNETVGVVIIRPVMKVEDVADHYEFDPEGSVLFIDLLICTSSVAMQALGCGVLKRFGMRKTVAWKRPPFFVIETHSAARLRRILFRKAMSYGRQR